MIELPPVAIQPDSPETPLVVSFQGEPKVVVDAAILDDRERLATGDSPIAPVTNELRVVGGLLIAAGLLYNEEPSIRACEPPIVEALANQEDWYERGADNEVKPSIALLDILMHGRIPDTNDEDTLLSFYTIGAGAALCATAQAADEFRTHPDVQQAEARTRPNFNQLLQLWLNPARHILDIAETHALDARAAHKPGHSMLIIEARGQQHTSGAALQTATQSTPERTIINVATPLNLQPPTPRQSVPQVAQMTELALRRAISS